MPNLPALAVDRANTQYEITFGSNELQTLSDLFSSSFKDFTTNGTRYLKVRKSGFELVDGATKEQIEFNKLLCMVVGIGQTNHAVWWQGSYSPGMEVGEPDLIWKMPDFETFPDALPVEYRKKVMDGAGNERWKFQIMRRLVLVRVVPVDGVPRIDVENPFVFDATSASLFGGGIPDKNQYKWNGIMNICRRYSRPDKPCYPCMFPIRIIPDDNMPVGVVNFQPLFNENGQICFIGQESLGDIMTCVTSEIVKSMSDVREKLEFESKDAKKGSKGATKKQVQAQPVEAQDKPIGADEVEELLASGIFEEAQQAFSEPNSQAEKNINNLLDELK